MSNIWIAMLMCALYIRFPKKAELTVIDYQIRCMMVMIEMMFWLTLYCLFDAAGATSNLLPSLIS